MPEFENTSKNINFRNMNYPYLKAVSERLGIPEPNLAAIFEAQYEFYNKIINEPSFEKRKDLYRDIYATIPTLFLPVEGNYFEKIAKAKTKIVHQLRGELADKSVLDIGSGSGAFLYALASSDLHTEALYGLDVVAAEYPKDDEKAQKIKFFEQNILDFDLKEQFDVIMMDNVYEHICLADLPYFYKCLNPVLKKGTKFILFLPHRMFGPSDYTRVLDNRQMGKTQAQGLHLNESTYTDVMADLKKQGFGNFKTTVPFIAVQKLRDIFPNLRLPCGLFSWYENSFLNKILTNIVYKDKPLFRMEVLIIAEYLG